MNFVFLFAGLFATILVFSSFSSFVYSLSNSTNNISQDDLTHQSTTNLPFKTLSPKVKEFILSNVVNKSKAALVVGFIDPNGTKVYSFGNISK